MSETFTNNVILDKVEKGVSTEDLQNTYQKKDYTFAEEVNASWQLQWIGQAVQNEIDFQKYTDEPDDPNYAWMSDQNMDGYEEHTDWFATQDIRNKTHHDLLKARIDRNNIYREVRDQGSLLAEFVSALGDPITYTPLPFIKGVTFANRAFKGAAGVGTLVASTEPVRRNLDPTSTNLETYAYIGGASIFGGILSGIFARRLSASVEDALKKTGDPEEAIEKVFKEGWDAEHVRLKANILDETVKNEPYKFNYEGKELSFNIKNDSKLDSPFGELDDNNLFRINFHRAVDFFESDEYMRMEFGQNIPQFRTASDYIEYQFRKALIKKDQPNMPFETVREQAIKSVLKLQEDRSTAGNKIFRKIGALFSDFEEVAQNKLPVTGGDAAKTAEQMIGDASTKTRANENGFATESSAIVESTMQNVFRVKKANKIIAQGFVKYKTGRTDARQIADYNVNTLFTRAGTTLNKVGKKFGKEFVDFRRDDTFPEFNEKVGKAMRSKNVYAKSDPVVKETADIMRELYDEIGEKAKNLGLFASQSNFTRLNAQLDGILKEIDDLAKTIPAGEKRTRLLKFRERVNKKTNQSKAIVNDFKDFEELDPLLKDYVNRVYNVEFIINELPEANKIWQTTAKNVDLKKARTSMDKKSKDYSNYAKQKEYYVKPPSDSLRGILYKAVARQTEGREDIFTTNVTVEKQINNILRNATRGDMDGDLGIGLSTEGNIKFGQSNFMSRNISATDEELDKYLVHDIEYLFNTYSDRIGKKIAMAERFGDSNATIHMLDLELKMIRDDWTPKTAKEIDDTLQRLYDMKDKYYGVFNNSDPLSFWKNRLPIALRNWASSAYMGEASFAAVVDTARVPMVHGLDNTWKYFGGDGFMNLRDPDFVAGVKANKWMFDAAEVVMNNTAASRFYEITNPVAFKAGVHNRFFDKLSLGLQKLQSPLYHLNGLSVWTKTMKDWAANISSHRFLEDSIKVSKGTATKFEKERLLSYGITIRDAKQIAKLPIQITKNGYHYTNADDWVGSKIVNFKGFDGEYLAGKLRQAVFQDVNRTIVTANIADKPNMMYGVIKIRSETFNKILNNGFGKWLGYEEKIFGGQINNGFLAIPLQFWSWSMAANRKLAVSGYGQGRDANLIAGVMGLLAMGTLADFLKNPGYYDRKPLGENIFRAVELSGTVDLLSQVNTMFETLSYSFDDPMGLRTTFGLEPRFRDQDTLDAIGGVAGAGASIFLDTMNAFLGDDAFEQRASAVRRMLPFNNLFWWDLLFHPYKAVEKGIVNIVD